VSLVVKRCACHADRILDNGLGHWTQPLVSTHQKHHNLHIETHKEAYLIKPEECFYQKWQSELPEYSKHWEYPQYH
jgi:hypothetical protein